MRTFILLLFFSVCVPACGPVASPPIAQKVSHGRALDDLLVLMRKRLEVMHEVAHYKWATKAPIGDPIRESVLLDDVAKKGAALGLDAELTQEFFRAQIDAAKQTQRADFRRWESEGKGPRGDAPDLTRVLRPRIDALNQELLAALANARNHVRVADEKTRTRAKQLIAGEGISNEARETAIRPLLLQSH